MAAPDITLATLNALIAQCGCCELPRCCPPLLECISFSGLARGLGFLPDDSGSGDESAELPDWRKTHWLRRVRSRTGISPADVVEDHPSGTGTYVAVHTVVDWVLREIEEYERPFEASIGSGLGSCRQVETPLVLRCEASGGYVQTHTAVTYWNGEWVSYTSLEIVSTLEEVSGEQTAEHAAWQDDYAAWLLAHPDFEAEYAAWQAAQAQWDQDYDAYFEAYSQWVNGDQTDPEPVGPGDPPTEPDAAPPEPQEFYPPCTYRQNFEFTYWEYGDGGAVLVESTEENPNPYNYSTVPISNLLGQAGTELITTHEVPVTLEEFIAAAEAWMNEQIDEAFDDFIAGGGSDSSFCQPNDTCGARKFSLPDVASPFNPSLELTNFRHRWKLNKCCGYKRVLSGWREVFFPLEYIQWYQALAGLGSSDDIPAPPVDLDALAEHRQWLWEGQPPLCNDSSSGSSEVDPFDHEPMWSPWSLTIKVPDGEEGFVVLRNYFQICYGTIPDPMPDVTGQINLSDSIPDGWTL